MPDRGKSRKKRERRTVGCGAAARRAARAAPGNGSLPAPAAFETAADPAVLQEDVAVEAGRGGAGMDGQDAQAGACGQGGAGRPADDAVLLVGLRDAQTGISCPASSQTSP